MTRQLHATEAQEQMTLVSWIAGLRLGNRRPIDYLVMIPNEGILAAASSGAKRHAYWAKLQKLGFRRGASDLQLALPVGQYHGLWLEMKRRREAFPYPSDAVRSVSEHQTSFLALMKAVGYATAIAFGWEEARRVIESYLAGNYKGQP